MLIIKNCSFSELLSAANWNYLVEEYGEEGAIDGLPTKVQTEMYLQREQQGSQYTIGAFLDGELIGFAVVLQAILPHSGVKAVVMDSIFVSKENRNCGAGLKLLAEVEEHAKAVNAGGIVFSAPINGPLMKLLQHRKYIKTRVVLFKNIQ